MLIATTTDIDDPEEVDMIHKEGQLLADRYVEIIIEIITRASKARKMIEINHPNDPK